MGYGRHLLIGVGVGATLALLVWLGRVVVREVQFVAHGVIVEGTVLASEREPSGPVVTARPSEHRVRYRYRDIDGRTHIGEAVLSDGAPRFQPGDPIKVRYLKHDPETSREVSATRIADSEGGIFLLGMGLAVLLILLALWATRSDSFAAVVSWLRGKHSAGRLSQTRRAILAEPFPDDWLTTLRQNLPVFERLSGVEQERLLATVQILVAERRWEPCGGMTLTAPMQVTIAGYAALLVLGMRHDYFSHVPTILVYPSAFLLPPDERTQGVAALGQAWYRGPVILAWDEVERDCSDLRRGKNVVLHEFAHQLDFLGEGGHFHEGSQGRERRRRWHEVMTREYQRLIRAAEQGRVTLLDRYGATNPLEFFAVATECFFILPTRMRQEHRELYEVLCDYYNQDPAERNHLSQ